MVLSWWLQDAEGVAAVESRLKTWEEAFEKHVHKMHRDGLDQYGEFRSAIEHQIGTLDDRLRLLQSSLRTMSAMAADAAVAEAWVPRRRG